VVFALNGKAKVPKQPAPYIPQPLLEPDFQIDEKLAERGMNLYWQCFVCHGTNVEAKGMAPDLRASPIVLSPEAFALVVREGIKGNMGMPTYQELTDEDLLALRHFIRKKAREKPVKRVIKEARGLH
jgi:quinohemoprotein ethanol dehydrogenase